MKLSQLFSVFPQVFFGEAASLEVKGISRDSREIQPGFVFVAISGHKTDGHDFLETVIQQGAIALVVSNKQKVPAQYTGAVVVVADTRVALHRLASHFYGNPADELFCVGVTGTNGKTTITYMVEKVLTDHGWKTGVMGTVDHHIGAHKWPSQLTTPDAIDLQKRLRDFVVLGARAAVFEVSSHALSQFRVDEIPFDVAVFSNLTRDHLDYHQTMEAYFQSKERLFRELLGTSSKTHRSAVINAGDDWGLRIQVADSAQTYYYGSDQADITFQILDQDFVSTRFLVTTLRGSAEVHLPIPGLFNVLNALAAIGVGLAAGISLPSIVVSLGQFQGVPGRLQRVFVAPNIAAYVDYAHTPDALEKVLSEFHGIRAKSKGQGKIITVFGCGGDRDKGKRPLMGAIAEKFSDHVFVTSDNPRTENPKTIADDILQGMRKGPHVSVELDRKVAIREALQMAQQGDVILVAGKGHENYQIIGQQVTPFDDVQVLKEMADLVVR